MITTSIIITHWITSFNDQLVPQTWTQVFAEQIVWGKRLCFVDQILFQGNILLQGQTFERQHWELLGAQLREPSLSLQEKMGLIWSSPWLTLTKFLRLKLRPYMHRKGGGPTTCSFRIYCPPGTVPGTANSSTCIRAQSVLRTMVHKKTQPFRFVCKELIVFGIHNFSYLVCIVFRRNGTNMIQVINAYAYFKYHLYVCATSSSRSLRRIWHTQHILPGTNSTNVILTPSMTAPLVPSYCTLVLQYVEHIFLWDRRR